MVGLKLQCEMLQPPDDLGEGNSRHRNSKGQAWGLSVAFEEQKKIALAGAWLGRDESAWRGVWAFFPGDTGHTRASSAGECLI